MIAACPFCLGEISQSAKGVIARLGQNVFRLSSSPAAEIKNAPSGKKLEKLIRAAPTVGSRRTEQGAHVLQQRATSGSSFEFSRTMFWTPSHGHQNAILCSHSAWVTSSHYSEEGDGPTRTVQADRADSACNRSISASDGQESQKFSVCRSRPYRHSTNYSPRRPARTEADSRQWPRYR